MQYLRNAIPLTLTILCLMLGYALVNQVVTIFSAQNLPMWEDILAGLVIMFVGGFVVGFVMDGIRALSRWVRGVS